MLNKQSQYGGDYFTSQVSYHVPEEVVDPKRIKRVEMLNQTLGAKQQKNDENRSKAPVKFHKFREDARKLHRQLAQQNHDFMKMTQTITKSVLDNDRYKLSASSKNNKNKDNNLLDQKNRQKKHKPNLIVNYDIELNSALTENKINTKQVFQLYPYKKLSIQTEPDNLLNPDFQFFFFRTDPSKSAQLQNNLSLIGEQGSASQIKQQIQSLTYYLDYFDYIQFCKYLYTKPKPATDLVQSKYPPQVLQLAKNALTMEGNSDQQDYNEKQLVIQTVNSCHRIFQCDQTQLTRPFDSIYFPTLQDFQNYKKYRIVEYKNLKIEAEDIVINTDVRNIISSQKIYLINIIQQMKLSVQLLKTNREQYLVKNLHQMMIKKIYQYLHLVCGYTTSTILIRFNITDPYSKIYEFLRKSILYGKQYQNLDRKVIQRYPVLQIWYHLPDKIYGYARQQIHNTLYRLIQETLQFQKNMKNMDMYNQLKIKQYDRKYLPQRGDAKQKPTNQKNDNPAETDNKQKQKPKYSDLGQNRNISPIKTGNVNQKEYPYHSIVGNGGDPHVNPQSYSYTGRRSTLTNSYTQPSIPDAKSKIYSNLYKQSY